MKGCLKFICRIVVCIINMSTRRAFYWRLSIAGGILLGLAVMGFIVPVTDNGWSIPQVHDLCSSGFGQLGQAFSGDIQQVCSEYRIATFGIYGIGLIGLILLIVGLLSPSKSNKKSLTCSYCNFVALSETELKHKSDKHLDKSPYVCEHCDFIGITEEILWNHYNDEHHENTKNNLGITLLL